MYDSNPFAKIDDLPSPQRLSGNLHGFESEISCRTLHLKQQSYAGNKSRLPKSFKANSQMSAVISKTDISISWLEDYKNIPLRTPERRTTGISSGPFAIRTDRSFHLQAKIVRNDIGVWQMSDRKKRLETGHVSGRRMLESLLSLGFILLIIAGLWVGTGVLVSGNKEHAKKPYTHNVLHSTSLIASRTGSKP